MYFLVPYNISPIQQGIQAGHAVEQYARKYGNDPEYQDYVDNHMTWMVMNGGTTNSKREMGLGTPYGSLNKHADFLKEIDWKFAWFSEPDLNDALTALCFLCDERIFNNEDYPHFMDWVIKEQGGSSYVILGNGELADEEMWRKKYVDFLGGEDIVRMKDFVSTLRFA